MSLPKALHRHTPHDDSGCKTTHLVDSILSRRMRSKYCTTARTEDITGSGLAPPLPGLVEVGEEDVECSTPENPFPELSQTFGSGDDGEEVVA
jgi:hypothetical protein